MTATLLLNYMPLEQLSCQSADWWSHVLGVVGFDATPRVDRPAIPVASSSTPQLGNPTEQCEVWRVTGEVLQADSILAGGTRIRYSHCEQFLFGCVTIDERSLSNAREIEPAAALRNATHDAYQKVFSLMRDTGHAHLIRVWNYLPDINSHSGGEERYRHFNTARAAAFAQSGQLDMASVPAASALGSLSGAPLCIYFIAARKLPMMIENPRQISAYRYPLQYGTHSPLFSRACVLPAASGITLFVSGTASIVGHETLHHGDVLAQTRETLSNITALLEETNRRTQRSRYSLDSLKYKVYLRNPADQPAVAAELSTALHGSTCVVYLKADVCRNDLLVEIEATGESIHPLSQAA